MGKRLVRDNALSNWRVPGAEHQVRPVRSKSEHAFLLRQKLMEEATEVVFAEGVEETLKELADVYEVMIGIAHVNGLTMRDVQGAAFEREQSSGGFIRGMVWETDR